MRLTAVVQNGGRAGGGMARRGSMGGSGAEGRMTITSRATDGSRFVTERARVWLADDPALPIAPALPVIDLARGELDRPAAPHIGAAVADALDRGETHYTSRPGIAPLRHALADRLAAETGIAYDPESEVLVSSGGQEGLFVTVQMLVRP